MLGYAEALEDLKRSKSSMFSKTILHSWFSDTFIIYSSGDAPEQFAAVEQVGQLFYQRLIRRCVPVRGAITHGQLYSQAKRNIFVGPALIDACQHAENQNWLGFVLTPQAVSKMATIGAPIYERPFYRQVPPSYLKKPVTDSIYGFTLNNRLVQRKNPYQRPLQTMRQRSDAAFHAKYDRTLDFIAPPLTSKPRKSI